MSETTLSRDRSLHRILDAWRRGGQIFQRREVFDLCQRRAGSPLADAVQRAVLIAIARLAPAPLNQVAQATGMTASNASKVTGGLVRGGLVTRQRPEADRRVTLLELTSDGADLVRRLEQVDMELLSERLTELDDRLVGHLGDLLERFIDIVESWAAGVAAEARAHHRPVRVTRGEHP